MIGNGGEALIEDGSLLLAHGRRYGLVGRNGTGKSTLLRAIANRNVAGLSPTTQVGRRRRAAGQEEPPMLRAVVVSHGGK